MKKILIGLITIYQNFFVYIIKGIVGVNDCCRFSPTCSEYAKLSIKEYGAIKGSILSLIRVLKCQPFYRSAI